ncbi:MAG: dephospho-CoA kinase [Bacteroidota bacterium]
MITVGVTGGIGSGKTTVCERWEELGAYVVYADQLAKRMMVENAELRTELIRTFGPKTYHPDGSLNKDYLTQEAFNKGRVDELNALVHPKVHQATKDLMNRAKQQKYAIFVYEAALLLDHGRPEQFDVVVIVLTDQEKRVSRVAERDNQSEALIERKVERQVDFKQLTHLSDYIIRNNGTIEELLDQADQLYQVLLSLSKQEK